jgi:hypothetical protein
MDRTLGAPLDKNPPIQADPLRRADPLPQLMTQSCRRSCTPVAMQQPDAVCPENY